MKKTILKYISCVLAVLFITTTAFAVFAANDTETVSEDAASIKEIPLLVIVAGFDANGNGINDYDSGDPDKLYSDKSASYYGEQWANTKPEDHYTRFFGETGYTITTYFKEMTCGHLTYVPAKFDNPDPSWSITSGVIPITVKMKHPTASGNAGGTIQAIIKACDPYIDFSKFDTNGDKKVTQKELGLMILNSGSDQSSVGKNGSPNNPKGYFSVWGTSQPTSVSMDGVTLTSGDGAGNVTNMGEHSSVGTLIPIGVPCHELAHNLGAEDLYNRNSGGGGSADSTWPQPYYFSLQCNGNNRGGGTTPAYLDPYQRIKLGFVSERVVMDGTHTLYSTLSGKYDVLRVNTPDPNEYYLIEIRLKEGFEKNLTSGGTGGIMVWHIDESINNRYYAKGDACSSYISSGDTERHDPGIVPLFREGWNESGTRIRTIDPSDPYYYLSDDSSTAVFNSSFFHSPTNMSTSLNSYPDNWVGEKTYNLKVEVLSKPGQEMQVKITTESSMKIPPFVTSVAEESTLNSITLKAVIQNLNGDTLEKYGFIVSTESEPTLENGKYVEGVLSDDKKSFSATVDGLEQSTKYYFRTVAANENAEIVGNPNYAFTASPVVEKTYFLVKIFKNQRDNERAAEVKVKLGETLKYSFPLSKTGFVFAGWYLDEALTEKYSMSYTQDSYSIITIYGKWISEAEAVSFKFMNADTKYLVFAVKAGETAETPVPADKEGFTFGGWYSDEGCTVPLDFSSAAANAGEVKVYAKWTSETQEQTTTTQSVETTTTTSTSSETSSSTEKENKGGNTVVTVVIIAVAVIAVVGIICFVFIKKKKSK